TQSSSLSLHDALPISSAEEIREVHIETLQTAVNIMAGDAEKWRPTNRETADHSMPYVAAVALKYGTVEPRHFDAEYWRDPELLRSEEHTSELQSRENL